MVDHCIFSKVQWFHCTSNVLSLYVFAVNLMNFQSNFNTKILGPETTVEEYYDTLHDNGWAEMDVSNEIPEEIICLDTRHPFILYNVDGTCLR